MLPPPLTEDFRVVRISSVEAALAQLNSNIRIEDVLKVINEIEESTRVKATADATQRRTVPEMGVRKATHNSLPAFQKKTSPILPLFLQPTETTTSQQSTAASESAAKPTERASIDPSANEGRRRLVELAKEAFPNGKAPDPLTSLWLAKSRDDAAVDLSFIFASRVVLSSTTNLSKDCPQTILENVWCLWDTGAQTSFIVTSKIDAAVRDHQAEGSLIMDICFPNLNQSIASFIYFRPRLPNDVTFIILGQKGFINRFEYSVQPVLINPQLLQQSPQAYGQLMLTKWNNPDTEELVEFEPKHDICD